MTTYVILAAGRGNRMGRAGDSLNKALMPLDGRAILTHLLDRAPTNAHVIVCTGYKGEQLEEYCRFAHPNRRITFVQDAQPRGPGGTLLLVRPFVTDGDLIFTSCDTLWEPFDWTENSNTSWAAVAPIPAGTPNDRWCRMQVVDGQVVHISDKRDDPLFTAMAYTGLAQVKHADQEAFWEGILDSDSVQGELQITGGFYAVLDRLASMRIKWTDVGDSAAYERAVAEFSGYDWTKLGQATYLLSHEGRVVKFHEDAQVIKNRQVRASFLRGVVPEPVLYGAQMMSYPFVHGRTGYQAAEVRGISFVDDVCKWLRTHITLELRVPTAVAHGAALRFYRDKTLSRVEMLDGSAHRLAWSAVKRVDWNELAEGTTPAYIHGDLNFGNMIVADDKITGIDWREDFAGEMWGDLRYDYAKLLAGTVVHWDRARRGDFRPWKPYGPDFMRRFLDIIGSTALGCNVKKIQVIAALSLINSAPLHASPLDEILVARGVSWLEQL